MCKILTVASQKGGVSKTSSVLNLAHALGLQGKRVLVL
ncbi:MAG: ParA family protein, partial [Oscillospiraceae bacterium]|nr:ParA family protein [Oscillospiraceae bacterium]